jgi:hypothetical protein
VSWRRIVPPNSIQEHLWHRMVPAAPDGSDGKPFRADPRDIPHRPAFPAQGLHCPKNFGAFPQVYPQLRGNACHRTVRMTVLSTGQSHGAVRIAVQPSQPMISSAPTPSRRLVSAAAAERDDLRRRREKLLDARETLQTEMARIEALLRALDQREDLLERLTGSTEGQPPQRNDAGTSSRHGPSGSTKVLRGPAIRRVAVEIFLELPEHPEALHYRQWYAALQTRGFAVAGKDPLAVFLTQLGRSPVVRRGTQSGVYELDRSAPSRLRQRLAGLHEELRRLAATPGQATGLAAARARRAQLHAEIGQVEKALEEAEAALVEKDRERPLAKAV